MRESNQIHISQAVKKGFIEMDNGGVADLSYPNSKLRRGRVQSNGWISPTITSSSSGIHKIDREDISDMDELTKEELIKRYKIRKLTEKETGRLMNVSDEDIDKMSAVQSKTQMYKQFGNSIAVNVLVGIFGQLFDGKEDVYKELAYAD